MFPSNSKHNTSKTDEWEKEPTSRSGWIITILSFGLPISFIDLIQSSWFASRIMFQRFNSISSDSQNICKTSMQQDCKKWFASLLFRGRAARSPFCRVKTSMKRVPEFFFYYFKKKITFISTREKTGLIFC